MVTQEVYKTNYMLSSKGYKVPNQFILYARNGRYFRSNGAIICFRHVDGSVIINSQVSTYTRTTRKYLNIFLGTTKQETEQNIKNGTYALADLDMKRPA